MEEKGVVITGVGFVTPSGIGKADFWDGICYGPSKVTKVSICNVDGIKSKVAGQVTNFNGLNLGLSQDEVERLDRFAQFGLIAAMEAVGDSKLNSTELQSDRTAVVTASAVGSATNTEIEWKRVSMNGQKEINAALVGKHLYCSTTPHQLSIEIKNKYDVQGPCVTVSTGCTSGIDVVGTAFNMIKDGEVDVCICGSSEAPITRIALDAFDKIGAVSRDYNETPEKASRPFDLKRDGFVIGEGSAFLVLETIEHALKRKADIYGEIIAYATVCNAGHMTGLKKEDDSTVCAIETAINNTSIGKEKVNYINAHGTSTKQNDIHETYSYKICFGDRVKNIPVSSIKASSGHALGAAGCISVGATALVIKNGLIPPTKNYEIPDPECDLDYVPNKARKADVDVAVVTGISFSGIHSTVLLKKYENE